MSSPKPLNPFAAYVKKNFRKIKKAGEDAGHVMTFADVIQIVADNYRKKHKLPSLGPQKKKSPSGKRSSLCDAEFNKMCKDRKPPHGHCHENAVRRSCRKSRSRSPKKGSPKRA